MDTERYEQAARDNVDRHLGDVCEPDDPGEIIADEAFALAFDGAVDAGATMDEARAIANKIAAAYG
jgi:hypothetical protein